jgi:heptosyltransferase-2
MHWVRRQRFSVIYDFQGNRTSRLLVRFSGAPKRVGTQPNPVYTCHPVDPYTRATAQNVFDRLNDTLRSAGLTPATTGSTMLYPPPSDTASVFQWKREKGIQNGMYALIHAGSSKAWPSKRWPKEKYLQLASRIEAVGVRCVWVGAAEDLEVNLYLSRHMGIDATDRFNLLQLFVLGKDALFAVTNDSGPMHILSAAGIPVYSFFGPTSRIRSHAAGQKQRVLYHHVDCSPCFLGTCPADRHHACLSQIEPDIVFSKIDEELGLSSGIRKVGESGRDR